MATIWPLLKQQNSASHFFGSPKMGRNPQLQNSLTTSHVAGGLSSNPEKYWVPMEKRCTWGIMIKSYNRTNTSTWRFPRFQNGQPGKWKRSQLWLKLRCIKHQLSGWKWHAMRDGNCSCLYAEQWHSSDVRMILAIRATVYVGYLWITVSQFLEYSISAERQKVKSNLTHACLHSRQGWSGQWLLSCSGWR